MVMSGKQPDNTTSSQSYGIDVTALLVHHSIVFGWVGSAGRTCSTASSASFPGNAVGAGIGSICVGDRLLNQNTTLSVLKCGLRSATSKQAQFWNRSPVKSEHQYFKQLLTIEEYGGEGRIRTYDPFWVAA
jgi:hypothetical protein